MEISREHLHTKTAEAIRQMIIQGRIGPLLPSERSLSVQLGISRPVLRKALAMIENAGDLEWRGKRRIIIAGREKPLRRLTRISLLCRHGWEVDGNETVMLREQAAHSLGPGGLDVEVVAAPACFGPNPARLLQQITEARPNTLWVLFRSTLQIQSWFLESGLPVLVLGGCHTGINLPSLDTDYFSICRHAAGLLIARGHREVIIIKTESDLPGDRKSLAGFTHGWTLTTGSKAPVLVTHNRETSSICRAVDRLAGRRDAPCVWLVFGARTYLTVAARLAEHRLRVGRDIHLLCRDSDPYFEFIVPTVAHYRRDSTRIKQRLMKYIQAFKNGEAPTAGHYQIPAEFVNGDSLGKAYDEVL
jgi:hypothetical protein